MSLNLIEITPILPENLFFIHAEELSSIRIKHPKRRPDYEGAQSSLPYRHRLQNGRWTKKHDGRAPDYDDWTTIGENGLPGLNGDLLFWDDVLGRSLEAFINGYSCG